MEAEKCVLCIHLTDIHSVVYKYTISMLKPGANESQKTLNICETRNKTFSHSSASPRNDKHCSAKQCFANQTNRCLADYASRSDLFLANEHG